MLHQTTLTKKQNRHLQYKDGEDVQSTKVAYLLVMGLHGSQVSLKVMKSILAGVQLLLHACQLGLQSCLPGAFTGMSLCRLHAVTRHFARHILFQLANPFCFVLVHKLQASGSKALWSESGSRKQVNCYKELQGSFCSCPT